MTMPWKLIVKDTLVKHQGEILTCSAAGVNARMIANM
jgi:hypothetical protein